MQRSSLEWREREMDDSVRLPTHSVLPRPFAAEQPGQDLQLDPRPLQAETAVYDSSDAEWRFVEADSSEVCGYVVGSDGSYRR